LDVPVQVELVGHVFEVAQHLFLLGVAFAPLPLLAELLIERVAVDPTGRIAARARVAVPVPRPADAAPASKTRADNPISFRNLWSAYNPENPAPTMTASKSVVGSTPAS
jgi:hypothetical protein